MDKSDRNRRAVLIGLAAAVIILFYHFVAADWLQRWSEIRESLRLEQEQLRLVAELQNPPAGPGQPAKARPLTFEMPQSQDKQRLLFERRLNEQLKKAGIKVTRMPQCIQRKAQAQVGLTQLNIRCDGQCNFEQAVDLLASLNENPYLVDIEEFQLKCGEKNREQMELVLVVSTFAR